MEIGSGKFSVLIQDLYCPWNEGTWTFETVDGGLFVVQGVSPECILAIQGLTALVYGVCRPDGIPYRNWGDPALETQAMMMNIFSPQVPYLHEIF